MVSKKKSATEERTGQLNPLEANQAPALEAWPTYMVLPSESKIRSSSILKMAAEGTSKRGKQRGLIKGVTKRKISPAGSHHCASITLATSMYIWLSIRRITRRRRRRKTYMPSAGG